MVYTGGMPVSGRERALQYLRDVVLDDPGVQGTFLNEVELAKEIGVSRTPVREAMLLLVADDLIELVPGRGAHVPPMTGRQVRELMDMRKLFESYAAERAIEARTEPVGDMRSLLVEQDRIATSEQVGTTEAAREFMQRDVRFHQALVDAAGNLTLSRSYSALRVRQRRVGMTALFRAANRQLAVCDEHRAIVDALEERDRAAAVSAIESHIDQTLEVLLTA